MNVQKPSSLFLIQELELLKPQLLGLAEFQLLGEVKDLDQSHPVYKINFGSKNANAPVLGVIGGVHGLERIGSEVCIALLKILSQLLLWDQTVQSLLENIRIFFIPTVNPWGLYHRRRSNSRGVDLMRNAPVTSSEKVPWLLGGHDKGSWLPWYRGDVIDGKSETMEYENQIVHQAVWDEVQNSSLAITVDFHSGFGLDDQIWFPMAKSSQPPADLSYFSSFFALMESTYPNHFYQIEPQAYRTHGDMWDYIFEQYKAKNPNGIYMPLTVEMGSWSWVRKNPSQFFSLEGAFHPTQPHRIKRTLRRHNTLFEFMMRALRSPGAWASLNDEQKNKFRIQALERWYPGQEKV